MNERFTIAELHQITGVPVTTLYRWARGWQPLRHRGRVTYHWTDIATDTRARVRLDKACDLR